MKKIMNIGLLLTCLAGGRIMHAMKPISPEFKPLDIRELLQSDANTLLHRLPRELKNELAHYYEKYAKGYHKRNYELFELLNKQQYHTTDDPSLYEKVSQLLAQGANPNYCHIGELTSLHEAIECINSDNLCTRIVTLLLSKGADPSQESIMGTPLHCAVNKNRNDLIKLLANKENINNQQNFGNTPLHWAVIKRNNTIMQELLELGANPSIKDGADFTPWAFLSAIENLESSVVTTFLTHGADIDAQDPHGNTLLHGIVKHCMRFGPGKNCFRLDTTKVLLQAGANFTLLNDENKSAIDYASYTKYEPLMALFINAVEQKQSAYVKNIKSCLEKLNT